MMITPNHIGDILLIHNNLPTEKGKNSMSAFPEYLPTSTITIDGGSIEFIPNYREAMQALQQKAKKLRSEIVAEKLMRDFNCPFAWVNSYAVKRCSNTPGDIFSLHQDFLIKLVVWAKEQLDLEGDSLGAFYSYFQEMNGYQKKYEPIYNNLIEEFTKVADIAEYVSDEHLKRCHEAFALMKESTRLLNAATRVRQSGVYIAAPSLSALIANEATSMETNGQADSYHQQAMVLRSKADELLCNVTKERVTEAVSIITKAVSQYIDTIMETALNDMLVIEGSAASKKEWSDFKQNFCNPRKYAALLQTCISPVGLEELMSAFL